jgi:predicted metal-dependent hydrolase
LRLSTPFADQVRIMPQILSKQYPGMSTKDILRFAASVYLLGLQVESLSIIAAVILDNRDNGRFGDDPRLAELWQEWKTRKEASARLLSSEGGSI